MESLLERDVIGIDEGQFVRQLSMIRRKIVYVCLYLQFSDIVIVAEKLANLKKIVIVAALDGTYSRKVLFLSGCA
jgi:hypothetical protein